MKKIITILILSILLISTKAFAGGIATDGIMNGAGTAISMGTVPSAGGGQGIAFTVNAGTFVSLTTRGLDITGTNPGIYLNGIKQSSIGTNVPQGGHCTLSAGTCTITWPSAFADTNYDVSCSELGGNAIIFPGTKTTTTLVVTSSLSSDTNTASCVAVHN
jgi:hypothetical protein